MSLRSLGRRPYIDWARALAVLIMIEAHTIDAWTRAADKTTRAFRSATIVGGFAAPLFLWLAGVGVALAAAGVARREGSRARGVEAVCRRGLEIFILAFLFRLQAFTVSPGSHPVTLFRVDILNIMGPAIAAAGVVWGLTGSTLGLASAFAVLAGAFALLTPVVRTTALVDTLPVWVQWYIRPAGEHTTFTAFPWAGFVFAGAACGVLIASPRDWRTERRLQAGIAATGVVLTGLGLYLSTRPTIYRESSFWTSSPTWFLIRLGVLMVVLAVAYALAQASARTGVTLRWLTELGQSSLFVYWVHVELVYGYATWRIHGRLPLWVSLAACGLFFAGMYGAVLARDRTAAAWRARRGARFVPRAGTA